MTETENMENHIPIAANTLQKKFFHVDFPIEEYVLEAVLEPKKTHQIPFSFVVPSHIPVQMCHHPCANSQIYQEHLELPPSLGKASQYFENGKDMSPNEAELKYSISFSIVEKMSKADWPITLKETIHPIYILPRRSEISPLLIDAKNPYYRMRMEKRLKRGVLRSKSGSLIVSTFQPPGIDISNGPQSQIGAKSSTTMRINFRFKPESGNQLPPRMVKTETKLKAMTFFGMEPWQEFPDLSRPSTWGPRQAFWSETISLVSEDHPIDWKPQGKIDDDTGTLSLFYTATVDLLATLPDNRVYPPTFHSCFISRTYSIKTMLSFWDDERARGHTSAYLTAPVQIYAS